MELENISLDKAKLEAKANELAEKAAIQELEDFYTGYNSPYKKAIRENLKNKAFTSNLMLPDIVVLLNEEISKKADEIVNTAIAKTYIPLATELFTRELPEIYLSEFLKEFISSTSYEYDHDMDADDFSFDYERRWPDSNVLQEYYELNITCFQKDYQIGIKILKNDEGKTYCKIQSLPDKISSPSKYMTILLSDDSKIEMPFTPGILKDRFTMYLARLIMAGTKIIFDVDGFDETMFPSRNNCHC